MAFTRTVSFTDKFSNTWALTFDVNCTYGADYGNISVMASINSATYNSYSATTKTVYNGVTTNWPSGISNYTNVAFLRYYKITLKSVKLTSISVANSNFDNSFCGWNNEDYSDILSSIQSSVASAKINFSLKTAVNSSLTNLSTSTWTQVAPTWYTRDTFTQTIKVGGSFEKNYESTGLLPIRTDTAQISWLLNNQKPDSYNGYIFYTTGQSSDPSSYVIQEVKLAYTTSAPSNSSNTANSDKITTSTYTNSYTLYNSSNWETGWTYGSNYSIKNSSNHYLGFYNTSTKHFYWFKISAPLYNGCGWGRFPFYDSAKLTINSISFLDSNGNTISEVSNSTDLEIANTTYGGAHWGNYSVPEEASVSSTVSENIKASVTKTTNNDAYIFLNGNVLRKIVSDGKEIKTAYLNGRDYHTADTSKNDMYSSIDKTFIKA